MAKTLKQMLEVYRPKSKDEQKFIDKHVVSKTEDANGNGDDVFNASNVKTVDRKKERHGNAANEDEKVYEETELEESEVAHAQYQKYQGDAATLLKKIGQGLKKHQDSVTANKNKAHWGHVGTIKDINRSLQDIHDRVLEQGEYAKPIAVETVREETEIESLSEEQEDDLTSILLELYADCDDEEKAELISIVESGELESFLEQLVEENEEQNG